MGFCMRGLIIRLLGTLERERPNASTQDYLGEALCRKKLQQSIDRGMFYVWADKLGTHRLPYGFLCVCQGITSLAGRRTRAPTRSWASGQRLCGSSAS